VRSSASPQLTELCEGAIKETTYHDNITPSSILKIKNKNINTMTFYTEGFYNLLSQTMVNKKQFYVDLNLKDAIWTVSFLSGVAPPEDRFTVFESYYSSFYHLLVFYDDNFSFVNLDGENSEEHVMCYLDAFIFGRLDITLPCSYRCGVPFVSSKFTSNFFESLVRKREVECVFEEFLQTYSFTEERELLVTEMTGNPIFDEMNLRGLKTRIKNTKLNALPTFKSSYEKDDVEVFENNPTYNNYVLRRLFCGEVLEIKLFGKVKVGNSLWNFPIRCNHHVLKAFISRVCAEPSRWRNLFLQGILTVDDLSDRFCFDVFKNFDISSKWCANHDEDEGLSEFIRLICTIASAWRCINQRDATGFFLVLGQSYDIWYSWFDIERNNQEILKIFNAFVDLLHSDVKTTMTGSLDSKESYEFLKIFPKHVAISPTMKAVTGLAMFLGSIKFFGCASLAERLGEYIAWQNFADGSTVFGVVSAVKEIIRGIKSVWESGDVGKFFRPPRILELLDEADSLVRGVSANYNDEEIRGRIEHCKELIYKLQCESPNPETSRTLSSLRDYKKTLLSTLDKHQDRVPPFLIFLVGQPGTGKTTYSNELINWFAHRNGIKTFEGGIINVNMHDKFPASAGLNKDAYGIVINDIPTDYTNFPLQDKIPLDLMLQQMIDTNVFYLRGAAVEDKGVALNRLRVVVITSNTHSFAMVDDTDKLLRRFENAAVYSMNWGPSVRAGTAWKHRDINDVIYTVLTPKSKFKVFSLETEADTLRFGDRISFLHDLERKAAQYDESVAHYEKLFGKKREICSCGLAKAMHVSKSGEIVSIFDSCSYGKLSQNPFDDINTTASWAAVAFRTFCVESRRRLFSGYWVGIVNEALEDYPFLNLGYGFFIPHVLISPFVEENIREYIPTYVSAFIAVAEFLYYALKTGDYGKRIPALVLHRELTYEKLNLIERIYLHALFNFGCLLVNFFTKTITSDCCASYSYWILRSIRLEANRMFSNGGHILYGFFFTVGAVVTWNATGILFLALIVVVVAYAGMRLNRVDFESTGARLENVERAVKTAKRVNAWLARIQSVTKETENYFERNKLAIKLFLAGGALGMLWYTTRREDVDLTGGILSTNVTDSSMNTYVVESEQQLPSVAPRSWAQREGILYKLVPNTLNVSQNDLIPKANSAVVDCELIDVETNKKLKCKTVILGPQIVALNKHYVVRGGRFWDFELVIGGKQSVFKHEDVYFPNDTEFVFVRNFFNPLAPNLYKYLQKNISFVSGKGVLVRDEGAQPVEFQPNSFRNPESNEMYKSFSCNVHCVPGECGGLLVSEGPNSVVLGGISANVVSAWSSLGRAQVTPITCSHIDEALRFFELPMVVMTKCKLEECSELEMRSEIRNVPSPHIFVVGSSERGNRSFVSKFRQTDMYEKFSMKLKLKYSPPRKVRGLIEGDVPIWKSAVMHQFGNLNMTDSSSYSEKKEAMKAYLNDLFRDVHDSKVNPLTLREAIFGQPKINVERIPFNTSVGPVLKKLGFKTKKDLFRVLDEQMEILEFNPKVLELIQKRMEDLSNGIVEGIHVSFTVKDEIRPEEKVNEFKLRLFAVVDFIYNIVLRMFTMPVVSYLIGNRFASRCMGGLNAGSRQWKSLHEWLTALGDAVFDIDFKTYDMSHGLQMLWLVAEFFRDAAQRLGYDMHLDVVYFVVLALTVQISNYLNDHFIKFKGMPSGVILTLVINSVVNSILLRMAFKKLVPEIPLEEFSNHVHEATVGDDNAVNVSDAVKEKFNAKSVFELYEKWGYKATPANKGEVVEKWTTIDKITFVKRRFVPGEGGRMFAPLEEDSIWRAFCFEQLQPGETSLERLQHVAMNAQREFFLYGREKFEENKTFIKEQFASMGRGITELDFDQLLAEFDDGTFTTFDA